LVMLGQAAARDRTVRGAAQGSNEKVPLTL
jgi:hypothetical protein